MILEQAIDVLKTEAEGILALTERIGDDFVGAVDLIYRSTGRVIIAGIGKSGIIGRKIVATLNSTGTRSIFLHPVEAMHGDLGIVSDGDVLLAISNSGETDELNILLPSIRKAGCPIIAFTGNPHSTLARQSDIVIDVGVAREACPLGLAPTTSTTAQLAMGDALAVVLLDKHKFGSSDFQKNHPGGNLGQRLSFQVKDIMLTGEAVPSVPRETTMENALAVMDRKGLGVIFVTDQDSRLAGIITDGDIRRMVVNQIAPYGQSVEAKMIQNPKHVHPKTPLYEALNILETNQITVLPVVEDDGSVRGALHLHDILGKGAVKFG
ncbi:MAG: KpsF/GutQ family sugar-phosphate isomerase [Thermodesulfobacteriota bacterium]